MRLFAVLLLAFLFPAVAFASNHIDKASYRVAAQMTVSETGEVAGFSVEPRFQAVEAWIAAVVSKWRFKPVLHDGVPVTLDTTVCLRVDTRPDGKGGLLADVSMTGNGSTPTRISAASYPVSAMRNGASGIVRLEVAFDSDGKVTGSRVLQSMTTVAQYRGIFERAAKRAASTWAYRPERVNGVGIPGIAVVSVTFRGDNGEKPRLPPPPESDSLADDQDELLSRSAHPLTRVDSEG